MDKVVEIKYPLILIDILSNKIKIWKNSNERANCSYRMYKKSFWQSYKVFDAKGIQYSIVNAIPHRQLSWFEKLKTIFAHFYNSEGDKKFYPKDKLNNIKQWRIQ